MRHVAVVVPSQVLRPGRSMMALAAVLDIKGTVLDVPVAWSTSTPDLLTVSEAGEVVALRPGRGILRAVAGSVLGQIELRLENPPAAGIELDADTLRLALPGAPTPVPARALDADGEVLVGAPIAWSVDATRIATVDAEGRVTPKAAGKARVIATVDGVVAARPLRVDVGVTATSPIIDSVRGATIEPGLPFTLYGSRFAPTVGGNEILVDGLPATVTAASATQVTALLPATTRYCIASGPMQVQLRTPGGVGAAAARMRVAPQRSLVPGAALVLTTPQEASCLELVDGAGRYLITVQHAARALGAGAVGLSLVGKGGEGHTAPTLRAAGQTWRAALGRASGVPALPSRRAAAASAHLALLESSRAAAAVGVAIPREARAPSLQLPAVNSVVPVRVPNLEAPTPCSGYASIGARLVWEGSRIAILEDTATLSGGAPTLAGRMDAELVTLAQAADAVLFPIAQRFGDPLVMDSRLDANGKIVIVVTPRMNQMRSGAVLGAVVTCDFFSRSQFQASNQGEMVYLQAPTSDAAGMDVGTKARWSWEMPGTLAHELKHITSYAERIVRGQPLEEPWLEEALARHAEELYARFRVPVGPDAGYDVLACELGALALDPGCVGSPRIMLPHFEGLWDLLVDPAAGSPLGPRDGGDVSFYGSAWSLLRWAMDHATLDEATFVRDLVRSGQTGLANLEARAGRGWDEMLGRWSLAMASELRGGAVPGDATLRLPSWNLSAVFDGLCAASGHCADLPTRFGRPSPLQPTPIAPAEFTLTAPAVVPGGFLVIELQPLVSGNTRLIELRGPGGASLPATARLAILRIE
ncbi:MAG: Ig-like domain-containing protein [Gemmatimonadaceae bacterium]|nr:Ig-like domain-containing protein [Gemmatimonadaceae bacterium]